MEPTDQNWNHTQYGCFLKCANKKKICCFLNYPNYPAQIRPKYNKKRFQSLSSATTVASVSLLYLYCLLLSTLFSTRASLLFPLTLLFLSSIMVSPLRFHLLLKFPSNPLYFLMPFFPHFKLEPIFFVYTKWAVWESWVRRRCNWAPLILLLLNWIDWRTICEVLFVSKDCTNFVTSKFQLVC